MALVDVEVENALRATRVVGNRRRWDQDAMPKGEYRRLLEMEAAESPGGWAQLVTDVAGLAQVAMELLASTGEGATFDQVLAAARRALVASDEDDEA